MTSVGIIHYKMGNITSVQNALEYLKIPVKVVRRAEELDEVSHLILPGVGAFPEGMRNLEELGFVEAITKNVIERKKPILGICLGMQLMATVGFEGEKTSGLNLMEGEVVRLPEMGLRIPHVGWNNIWMKKKNAVLTDDADFYFVHSFHFRPENQETIMATSEYGVVFAAAVNRDNIYGVQFHPEKSQQAGLNVLRNFSLC